MADGRGDAPARGGGLQVATFGTDFRLNPRHNLGEGDNWLKIIAYHFGVRPNTIQSASHGRLA
jgi:hypothetical protein